MALGSFEDTSWTTKGIAKNRHRIVRQTRMLFSASKVGYHCLAFSEEFFERGSPSDVQVGNLVQVHRFPTDGKKDRKGLYKQTKQISYTCKEPVQFASLANGKGRCASVRGLAAYRMNPSAYGNKGWVSVSGLLGASFPCPSNDETFAGTYRCTR